MTLREGDERLGGWHWVQVLGLAVLVRLLGYSGYFGSDEVTYTEYAFKLAAGNWAVSDYVGANRLGVNLPVAAFAWLFGQGEWAAAAYSMLCSLLEVALVAGVGARLVGARAAWLAALVLACLPLHAHLAGRMMADAPLAMAMTACFLFFARGEHRGRALHYALAGVAAGWSFWIKPHALIYVLVLLSYPLVFRRFNPRWLWVVGGFAVLVLVNCALFGWLTGRFFYMFEIVLNRHGSGYLETDVARGLAHDSIGFYATYLFGKVHHTWLLGPLALVGLVLSRRAALRQQSPGAGFVVFWGLGLLLVLSAMPVKLDPLTFVPKQTNYMTMFAAPLALLAGLALSRLQHRRLGWAMAAVVLPSIALTLLLQASITVFTANAKAIVAFARERPATLVYTNTNPYRAAQFDALIHPQRPEVTLRPVSALSAGAGDHQPERLAVIDEQTLSWGRGEPYRRIADLPRCWIPMGAIQPDIEGLGPRLWGHLLLQLQKTGTWPWLSARLQRFVRPQPAHIFKVPPGC